MIRASRQPGAAEYSCTRLRPISGPTFSTSHEASPCLPFVAVEVEFLDHPGLPAFLFRDGDAQVPGFNRGGEVQPRVRFTHHACRDHSPGLAIVGSFHAIERRPAKIL